MTKLDAAEESFRSPSVADVETGARRELQQQSVELRTGETPVATKNGTTELREISFGYPQELAGQKFDPTKYSEGASGEGLLSRIRQQREDKPKPNKDKPTDQTVAEQTDATVSSEIGADAVDRVDPRRNFTVAADGSITAKFPNGDTRKFTTDGGKEIQTLEYYDNKNKLTHSYKRISAAEGEKPEDGLANFEYTQKDASGKTISQGKWKGDLEWRDGVYAVREAPESKSAVPSHFWRTELTDGTSQRERTNADGTTEVYDKNWGLTTLKRPDGSSVECARNEQGALTAVTHKNHDGNVTTWRPDQRGYWIANSPDMAPLTKPPVDKQGELNYVRADGTKVTVKTDGREVRSNTDGTAAITDPAGRIAKVVAADGSYRELTYQDAQISGFSEFTKDGSPKNSTEGHKKIHVDDHGYMSYERSDGTSVQEGPSGSQVEKYADGRTKSVRYPNGDAREFTYMGDTDKIDAFKLTTVNPKSIVEYDRIGEGEEFTLKSTNAAGKVSESNWKGDMAFRHGMFAHKGDGAKPGFWNERAADGKVYYERENADGSSQIFDSNLKISAVYRTDGTELHCQRSSNGELVGVSSLSADKVQTNWTLNKQNTQWESDSDQVASSKSPPINANGELLFHNTDGTHNKIMLNGTSERTNLDGTKASLDEFGVVHRLDRPDGTYRLFNHEDGKMTGYTDHAKDGKETKSVKDLKEPMVNSHGDVGHRDENGQRVLERTDGSTVKYDKDNDSLMSEVKAPDGSVRRFYHEPGTSKVQQVLDTTYDGKQWNQDLWQARSVIAQDGSLSGLSNTFERVDLKSGKVLERRSGVQFGDFGDYSFTGTDGKSEASNASRGFRVPKPAEPAKATETPVNKEEPTRREMRQNRRNPQPEQPKPKAEVENAEPEKSEPVKTIEAPQVKEVAVPSAAERRAELAKTNVTTGEDGSIIAKFPNGDSRSLEVVEGTNEVSSLKLSRASDKHVFEYTRVEHSIKADGNADFKYTEKDANGRLISQGTWSGAMQWNDNVFSSKDAPKQGVKSDGMWRTVAIDGERTKERRLENGSKLVYDDSGLYNLIGVNRPDGSQIECSRVNGNLTKITDRRTDGSKTTFSFDEKARLWVSDDKSIVPSATVPVNKQGELEYTDQHGSRTKVDFNGAVQRTNPDGSIASLEKSGEIGTVTLPSGDYRVFKRAEDGSIIGFSEHQKNGTEKRTVNDILDAKIDHYGLLDYRTQDGTKVSEGPNGVRVEQTPPNKTFIQYPDGDTRAFVAKEDGGLGKITHYSAKEKLTREYTPSSEAGKWDYKIIDQTGKEKHAGVWQGQMEFRDGLFAVKGENTKAPKGFWFERDASNNQFTERENPDGSRQRFDAKTAQLETLYRADGSRLDCHRPEGQLTAVRNVDSNGVETTWSFDSAQGKWVSSSPDVVPSTKSPVTETGRLVFQTKDGAQNQVESDGSIVRTIAGGAKVEISPEGVTSRITQRNGDYRVVGYDKETGKLTGYVDFDKTGKQQKSVELSDAKINRSGDIEHSVNGVRTVERADRSTVQFEPEDPSLVKRVTSQKGSYREFIRDENNEVTAIDDVAKLKSGEKHVLWTRRENIRPPFGPGGLSDTFERVVVNTSRVLDTRSNVAVGAFGDYSYRDGRGKDRISSATGRSRGPDDLFGTVAIDEAHDALVDSAAACFGNESRAAAFEQLMKGFERRMAETVDRRSSVEDREKVEEEVEKEVTQAYEAIARMMDPNAKGFDDPARRTQLAEALMYLLWEPQTAKQSGRNSCWFMSQWNEDLASHPGTFAKMFSDVSMTGRCKDRHNETYEFTADGLAQTRENHGVGWHLGRAGADSQTSPAVDRMERILLKVGGWDTYRWQNGGYSEHAKNALAKVVPNPIGFLGGQFPSTRQERLDMMRLGGAVKDGGYKHVNNMFVRAVRLDALGKVIHERAEERRDKRAEIVDRIASDNDTEPRRTVFGLFRGDQYEGGDKLVALIKDPKAFVETGEAAAVGEINYPAPKLGKEFQVADAYDASDFKPGTRPGDRNNRNNNNNNRVGPIRRLFRG